MILVLLTHANFVSLGIPTTKELTSEPVITCVRVVLEALTLVCVNSFVLISGYFGIRCKVKGFLSLLCETCFYYYGIYFFVGLIGLFEKTETWSIKSLLLPISSSNWYILQYMILYLSAPIINCYIESVNKKNFQKFIICQIVLSVWFGFIMGRPEFGTGFSFVFMIALYSIGRYLAIYGQKFVENSKKYILFVIYILCSVFNSCIMIFWHIDLGMNRPYMLAYNNPLVIISSIAFFLIFLKMKFYNNYINIIAKSTLAVLLIHTHPILKKHFIMINQFLFKNHDFLTYFIIDLLLLSIVFISAILIDRIRLALEKRIFVFLKIGSVN